MLVVLAIMGLAATLLVSSVNLTTLDEDRIIINLKSELYDIRNDAIASSTKRKFSMNNDRFRYEAAASGSEELIFYPDGSSTGGKIFNNEGQLLVQINWRNGAIQDVS